jgi:hypothetical protein
VLAREDEREKEKGGDGGGWCLLMAHQKEGGSGGGRPRGGGRGPEGGGGRVRRLVAGTGPWLMGASGQCTRSVPSRGDGSLTHGPRATVTGGAV